MEIISWTTYRSATNKSRGGPVAPPQPKADTLQSQRRIQSKATWAA